MRPFCSGKKRGRVASWNRFFEYVVAAHGLAEVFFREWSLTKINEHFAHVLSALGKAESQALWLSVGGLLADTPQTYW